MGSPFELTNVENWEDCQDRGGDSTRQEVQLEQTENGEAGTLGDSQLVDQTPGSLHKLARGGGRRGRKGYRRREGERRGGGGGRGTRRRNLESLSPGGWWEEKKRAETKDTEILGPALAVRYRHNVCFPGGG